MPELVGVLGDGQLGRMLTLAGYPLGLRFRTYEFENHLRAVLGLPLGLTAPVGHTAMLNLIGRLPDRLDVLSMPGAHLHLYAKAARPGRKLGHVTLRAGDLATMHARLALLQKIVP